MELVRRFAQALDDEDYATAATCLAPDAEYDTGDTIIRGIDAIIESFRNAAELGRKTFDSVVFRHEISVDAPLDIRFIDILQRNGTEFVLDHTMRVRLSDDGQIGWLRLSYPPGERERLSAFLKESPSG